MISHSRWMLFMISMVAIVNSATNGFDGSMMNNFLSLPYYVSYFKLDTATLALNNAIINVGGFVAFVYSGWIADKFGRRGGMGFGAGVTIVGVILQSAAVEEVMFCLGRFLIGNGMTITAVAAPSYIAEMAHPLYRGAGTSVYNSAWYIGSLLVGGITLGTVNIANTWSWRIPSILQLVPSALCILFLFLIPESPRWLIQQNRDEEALQILVKYHADGDDTDPLVLAEFQEIKDTITYEKEQQRQTWRALIATPGNRKRLWINFSVGFLGNFVGNNIASYYLVYILDGAGYRDSHSQLVINTLLSLANLLCCVVGILTVDKIGRRFLFLASTSALTVFIVIIGVLTKYYGGSNNVLISNGVSSPHSAGAKATVAAVFLFMGSYSMAWTPLSVLYPVEVQGYSIRAKGMALNAGFVFSAAFINGYIIPYAMDGIGWIFFIITGAICAGMVVNIYFFFPETKNRTLEELDEVFDGEKHSDVPNLLEMTQLLRSEKSGSLEKSRSLLSDDA